MFDKQALLKRMDNDEEIAQEIIQVFIDTTPELIQTIEKALSEEPPETIQRHAHSLKGAAANVEATEIRELALQLENSAKENTLNNAPELVAQIKTAMQSYQDAVAAAF